MREKTQEKTETIALAFSRARHRLFLAIRGLVLLGTFASLIAGCTFKDGVNATKDWFIQMGQRAEEIIHSNFEVHKLPTARVPTTPTLTQATPTVVQVSQTPKPLPTRRATPKPSKTPTPKPTSTPTAKPTPTETATPTATATEEEPHINVIDTLFQKSVEIIAENNKTRFIIASEETDSAPEIRAMADIGSIMMRKLWGLALHSMGKESNPTFLFKLTRSFFENGGVVYVKINGPIVVSYDSWSSRPKVEPPCCPVIVHRGRYTTYEAEPATDSEIEEWPKAYGSSILGLYDAKSIYAATVNRVQSNSGEIVFIWEREGKIQYMAVQFQSRYKGANTGDVTVDIRDAFFGKISDNYIEELEQFASNVNNTPDTYDKTVAQLSTQFHINRSVAEALLRYTIFHQKEK